MPELLAWVLDINFNFQLNKSWGNASMLMVIFPYMSYIRY